MKYTIKYSNHDHDPKAKGQMIREGKEKAKRTAELLKDCGYKEITIE